MRPTRPVTRRAYYCARENSPRCNRSTYPHSARRPDGARSWTGSRRNSKRRIWPPPSPAAPAAAQDWAGRRRERCTGITNSSRGPKSTRWECPILSARRCCGDICTASSSTSGCTIVSNRSPIRSSTKNIERRRFGKSWRRRGPAASLPRATGRRRPRSIRTCANDWSTRRWAARRNPRVDRPPSPRICSKIPASVPCSKIRITPLTRRTRISS
mmetsp:Transcript_50321/g.151536  ORF Transcript_50321/g.151536 Transcript_50321/m.151536 type:complete len:214 (+) Transcript_50321:663-1304(+)